MKNIINSINSWLGIGRKQDKGWVSESNRYKHMIGGAVLSLIFGIGGGICAAGCLEFKDVQWSGSWDSWDWADFFATIIGSVVGGIAHFSIVYCLFF
jgi:hypothetical protein